MSTGPSGLDRVIRGDVTKTDIAIEFLTLEVNQSKWYGGTGRASVLKDRERTGRQRYGDSGFRFRLSIGANGEVKKSYPSCGLLLGSLSGAV